MLTFRVARWGEVKAELAAITARHWAEMPFDLELPLSLDEELYEALDAKGRLIIVTARAADRLVGYYANFIARHPHYDILTAAMDVYFLLPEYRRGTNGLNLFSAMEKACKERGVKFMVATARLDRSPGAGRLMERLGWTPARMVYQRRLK